MEWSQQVMTMEPWRSRAWKSFTSWRNLPRAGTSCKFGIEMEEIDKLRENPMEQNCLIHSMYFCFLHVPFDVIFLRF